MTRPRPARKRATPTPWSGDRRSFPTKMRARTPRRDPICVECHARPSTIADPIIPVAEGGTDTIDNGQGMCEPCHDTKSKKERERARQSHRPSTHTSVAASKHDGRSLATSKRRGGGDPYRPRRGDPRALHHFSPCMPTVCF